MARPAKSIDSQVGHITKANEEARKQIEKITRGGSDKLRPPAYLNKNQKKIFKYIINELDESKLLGNLDLFILAKTAITIDQLQSFDKQSNEDPANLLLTNFRMAKDSATKDFFRCCNELCLSPQSRAKISISASKPDEGKKTLFELINDDDDD